MNDYVEIVYIVCFVYLKWFLCYFLRRLFLGVDVCI